MLYRFSKLLLITVCLFSSGFAYAKTLSVGYDNSPPHHYRNEKGEIIGTDVEVLNLISKESDFKFYFKEAPWQRTLQGIENGYFDLAIGAKFTEERSLFAHYTVPYKIINHYLYTHQDEYQDIDSLKDFLELDDVVLGIMRGWGYPDAISVLIRDEKYKDKIIEFNHINQLPKMLKSKRIDAMLMIPESLVELGYSNFSIRARYNEELHYLLSKKSVDKETFEEFNKILKSKLESQ